MKFLVGLIFSLLTVTSINAMEVEVPFIYHPKQANYMCTAACAQEGMVFTGSWYNDYQQGAGICECFKPYGYGRGQGQIKKITLNVNPKKLFKGKKIFKLKQMLKNQKGINASKFILKSVKLVAKSKKGHGKANLIIGDLHTQKKNIDDEFSRIKFKNPRPMAQGVWQLAIKGKIKVRKIVLELKKKFRNGRGQGRRHRN